MRHSCKICCRIISESTRSCPAADSIIPLHNIAAVHDTTGVPDMAAVHDMTGVTAVLRPYAAVPCII